MIGRAMRIRRMTVRARPRGPVAGSARRWRWRRARAGLHLRPHDSIGAVNDRSTSGLPVFETPCMHDL